MSPVSLYSCNITLSVVSVLGGGCEIGERDNLRVAIKMLGEKNSANLHHSPGGTLIAELILPELHALDNASMAFPLSSIHCQPGVSKAVGLDPGLSQI